MLIEPQYESMDGWMDGWMDGRDVMVVWWLRLGKRYQETITPRQLDPPKIPNPVCTIKKMQ